MKNKGFTLIELLAVIVILAIIALIATPLILNIISDAREESNKRSIELYKSAVENAFVQAQMKGENIEEGYYFGSRILKNKNSVIKVEYEGTEVNCIAVKYESGIVKLIGPEVGKKPEQTLDEYLLETLYSGVKIGETVNYQDGVGEYTWKILGTENDHVLLVSDKNIDIDGDGNYYDADDYLVLSGKNGYNNGISILNDMCKPLGQGKGAIGARSIRAEDINNITDYDPSNLIESVIDGVKYGGGPSYKGQWNEYGSTATYQMRNGKITYSNTNGLTSDGTNVDYTIFTNLDGSVLGETPLKVQNTCYAYRVTNATKYPTDFATGPEDSYQVYYNMPESLFNTMFDNPYDYPLPYWLATQGVWAREIGTSYGLLNAYQEFGKNGARISRDTYLYHTCKGEATVGSDNSDGSSSPYKDKKFGVRPVVILDLNVKFTSNQNGGYDINI